MSLKQFFKKFLGLDVLIHSNSATQIDTTNLYLVDTVSIIVYKYVDANHKNPKTVFKVTAPGLAFETDNLPSALQVFLPRVD